MEELQAEYGSGLPDAGGSHGDILCEPGYSRLYLYLNGAPETRTRTDAEGRSDSSWSSGMNRCCGRKCCSG